jgi:murein DD-endopeptidase MepM/ murein hydrolase activator NlpD
MHKGIDVANNIGTPIVASRSGQVVKAGWDDGGYGYLVEILHTDGSRSRYAHNSRILVRPGDQVNQGAVISQMGSTGRSTGPHLHFEILPAGRGAMNPLQFLPARA